MAKLDTFDPASMSTEENEFLLLHAGEPPLVAMRAIPPTVNPRAVRPILDRVYELQELQAHAGVEWVGVEKLREGIRTFLDQSAKWAQDKRRGAPRFPSLYSFDMKNRPHRFGPGSDAGQVRTYIDKEGRRVPFAVDLVPDATLEWEPEWATANDEKPNAGLVVNAEANRIECSVCGHTEGYRKESRGSFNAARARMSKHLRSATEETEAHRDLHTLEFGA